MNREEFMRQLEALLADIAEEEKREAIAFYESYFEDAGEENEQKVIDELESPEKVAASIKKDFMGEGEEKRTQSEPERNEEKGNERAAEPGSGSGGSHQKQPWGRSFYQENRTLCIVLVVVGVVLLSPVWGSLLGGVLALFGVIFGGIVAFGGMALGFSIGGIAVIGFGIAELFANAALGIVMIGTGLIMVALAVLSILGLIWLCGKVIPWILECISSLWHRLFPKGGTGK